MSNPHLPSLDKLNSAMKTPARSAFTMFQLMVVLAILGILLGLLLPAIFKARQSAGRIESMNNLKQLALACHVYHDANNNFPSGNDANNFSAHAHLLPYIEAQNIFNDIDFQKPVTDKANDKARGVGLRIFLSPLDPRKEVRDGVGATNYLFCAGSKPALKDNDGVFYQDSKLTLAQITNGDGTSNTVMALETLKGDGGTKAEDVARQYVRIAPPPPPAPKKVTAERLKQLVADLGNDRAATRQAAAEELEQVGEAAVPALKKVLEKKPALDLTRRVEALLATIAKQNLAGAHKYVTDLKADAGVQDWKAGKNIAGDRGASWMDGRFLQGTMSLNRLVNDSKPDTSCAGLGGYSGMRILNQQVVPVAYCDGHVANIPTTTKLDVLKALATWNGGEQVPLP